MKLLVIIGAVACLDLCYRACYSVRTTLFGEVIHLKPTAFNDRMVVVPIADRLFIVLTLYMTMIARQIIVRYEALRYHGRSSSQLQLGEC